MAIGSKRDSELGDNTPSDPALLDTSGIQTTYAIEHEVTKIATTE